jgi:hypothetical protein
MSTSHSATATYRKKIHLVDQLAQIAESADEAQRRIDFDSAHDEEILSAINIVEDFLRASGRICYGGSAMNVHLPAKYKFYDPKYTIPDYDFLTTDSEGDINRLRQRFKSAGFTEIGIRPGMHEGTTKVYINYTPVADITDIDPALYRMFKKHATKDRGITYMDANSLRMMMYLELSRPRGEVERWSKVYERLLLLQYAAPMKSCASKERALKIPLIVYRTILYYIIQTGRVLAGAHVIGAYKESLKRPVRAEWLFTQASPLIIYTPDATLDIKGIEELLGEDSTLKVKVLPPIGDFIPEMRVVTYYGKAVLLLVQETACHSYNTLELKSGKFLKIASLDTLITLYLSIMLRGAKSLRGIFPTSALCMAQQAVELSTFMRRHPNETKFPFISLSCSGHQKGLPSLLREKVARIQAAKTQKSMSSTSYSTRSTRRAIKP